MCIALAIMADLKASKLLFKPLSSWDIKLLEHYHFLLSIGLVILWISGLCLIGAATQFDPAQFTPKLITKILVVVALTANAFFIGNFALPSMEKEPRQRMGDMSSRRRYLLCLFSGVSMASWFSAYCLGAFPIFKPMPAEPLAFVFGHVYGIAILGALTLAGFAGLVLRSDARADTPEQVAAASAVEDDIEYDEEPLLMADYEAPEEAA
jgi:hypothetical protein